LGLVSFYSFCVFDDLNPHGSFRRFDWRDFQHGHESRALVFRAVQVAPGVAAFGFWVAGQVKDFNMTLPDGLTAKHFMHWHGFTVNRTAIVQVLNCRL